MNLIRTEIVETYYLLKNKAINLLGLQARAYGRDIKKFYKKLKKYGTDKDD